MPVTQAARADSLTLAHASLMIREALKDRSYRATPLGLEVARYYRWKKNEWGATKETLRDYEAILARLALFFADLELRDFAPPVGTERLRECRDHYWDSAAPRTKKKVRSVWIDFFDWAGRERGLVGNPARGLQTPRVRDTRVETFPPSFVKRVIAAQTYPADTVIAKLILQYGLRRGGLANIQRKHFDFERQMLTIFTKGGRIHEMPLRQKGIWLALGRLDLEAQWQDDHWLVYRRDTRRMKVPVDQATEILTVAGRQVGYADVLARDHTQAATPKLVHLRWYDCLFNADFIPKGQLGGFNMHRGRHTAATELQRKKHDLRLTQDLLGHADIRSTAKYASLDTEDLADALIDLYGED